MASSSPDQANAKSKNEAAKLFSGCGIATSAFVQTPFNPQFFRANDKILTAVPRLVRNLHIPVASNVDKFRRYLYLMASQNPFLKHLVSLSSGFHSVCQIQCRNNQRLNSLSKHNFAAILPGDSVAGIVVANGIQNFLSIYNTLLVVRLVLTWFPNTPPAIVSPLSTLCDPYLNIFRGVIPPLGGTLDLSPILAFVVLNAFSSTAAALPAELPSTGASCKTISNLSTSQKKWRRRHLGNCVNNSEG
ncbi:hypothetical protein Nepgr_001005 [Nepenthes gracilis]|uniref:Uncharacterized protein n=1 Tax=Nepenthes gracilis TaxID=150966 RepID=A0AAD3RX08_NEPGR|nr:hypothetical protein Nepgr_001005 [Nepenthes gracilis]